MDNKSFIKELQYKSTIFNKIITAGQELIKTEPGTDVFNYLNLRLSENSIKKYNWTYFPTREHLETLYDFVSKEELKFVRAIYENKSNQISSALPYHPIIFPIYDDFSNIVSLGARTLLEEEKYKELSIGKYKYIPYFKNHVLYGLNWGHVAVRGQRSVILTEGQLDTIACHAEGYHNAVALGGTSLSRFQYYLIRKYAGPEAKIYVLTDNDAAGDKAYDKIAKQYNSSNIIRLKIPKGYKDVDEFKKHEKHLDFLNV